MIRTLVLLTVVVTGIANAQPSATPAAAPPKVIVKAARMFDGRADKLRADVAVLIEGDTIREIGSGAQLVAKTPGVRVIDLGNATLLPGLVDAHTHLLGDGSDDYTGALTKQSLTARAIAATAHARIMLTNGFTTLRDAETEGAMYADADLAAAIERGIVVGPRLFVSTRGIAPTGGYLPNDNAWDWPVRTGVQVVDGVDEIRRAIREQVRYGATWIKVYADFGMYLGKPDRPFRSRPNFTLEELRAVVDESHRLGRKVAAHATGWDGIDMALRVGVDSIEHGFGITDDLAVRMAKQGVAFVPTIFALKDHLAGKPKAAPLLAAHKLAVKRALAKGVKIANGSDAGSFAFSKNATVELAALVEYGLTPAQAMKSATSVAGELLDPLCAPDQKDCQRGRIGVIAPNAYADLIAVDGNPLENVGVLAKPPRFVMKAGAVFVGP